MIPLRDTIPSQTVPVVNYLLIVVNLAVFVYQFMLPEGTSHQLITDYGIVPLRTVHFFIGHDISWQEALLPLFSYMFLHGGVLHLAGNTLYLWIFGDNVEDYFGHLGYLVFYLLSGVGSAMIHLLLGWSSDIPTIGASGAIAGVMGAYLVLYPRARVLTLVPIFIFIQIMEVPAIVFLAFWILIQFISVGGGQEGVAWWAHIGGFFVGIALLLAFQSTKGGKGSRGHHRGNGGNGGGRVIHLN